MFVTCLLASACSPAASAPVTWQRKASDPVFAGAAVNGVAFGNGVWVAVGSITGSETDGRIWTSTDGATWTSVATGDALKNTTLVAVSSSGTGFAAVGGSCGQNEGCATAGEVFVTSTDGQTWTRQAIDPGTCCQLQSITTGGPGLIAVGSDFDAGFPAVPADAAVTLSTDGTSWMQVPNNSVFTGATMGDVASGTSVLAAIGYGSGKPQIWSSADGHQWQNVSGSSLGTGQANSLTFGGGKFVAVGSGSQNDVAVWTSDATAQTWTRGTSPGPGGLNSVVASGALFVAGGKNGNNATLYTSTDGLQWTQTSVDSALAADSSVNLLAADGATGLVAFGVSSSGAVVLWTGTRAGQP
ncbi:MAG: hypothetical protein QFC55_01215 [Chloroflexota bacterium]|nr:hypothetical protein [Chloroflexota bacterium]